MTSRAALAQSGLAVRKIPVDVAPWLVNAGDPTAIFEQELPRQLARALAGRLTPSGGTLPVRIDYLTLGPNRRHHPRRLLAGQHQRRGDARRRAMAGAGDE
jgi:hypothetical protein